MDTPSGSTFFRLTPRPAHRGLISALNILIGYAGFMRAPRVISPGAFGSKSEFLPFLRVTILPVLGREPPIPVNARPPSLRVPPAFPVHAGLRQSAPPIRSGLIASWPTSLSVSPRERVARLRQPAPDHFPSHSNWEHAACTRDRRAIHHRPRIGTDTRRASAIRWRTRYRRACATGWDVAASG